MIWVIGANGMLGTELCRLLKENNIDFEGTDRSVDITDFAALFSFAAGKKIDFIVNCAAYTAVDKAESDQALAEKLNADGPRNIARVAKKIGAKLIHISTDYVFDGTASSPLTENLPVKPIGVYGETKALGEKAVQEETSEYYILRTAWLYGWDGKNFVYTMIRAMNSHPAVKVVDDQKGTPTFCGDLACVIIKITQKNIPYGIYHVTDEGETTWFGFACEIKNQAEKAGLITNKSCKVNPCTTSEYPTPAKRPAYSVLSKRKIQDALEIKLPEWKESLKVFLESSNFNKEMIK